MTIDQPSDDLRPVPWSQGGVHRIDYPEQCRPLESLTPKVNMTLEDALCVIGCFWPPGAVHEIELTATQLQAGCSRGVSGTFVGGGLVLRVDS